VSAASDLLTNYQHVISHLTLIMGEKGIFDVTVDSQPIYSKATIGRHAEPGEVLALFTDLVGDIKRYGDE